MKRYGLIGKTLKHSFSKDYFTQKFIEKDLSDCSYDNFELPTIDLLPDTLQRSPDLNGFNITIPYKEAIIPYLDFKNEIVEEIGACNCVKITNGKLYGYNTDVVGFKESLLKFLQPPHTHALVLGTGGAAKAVKYVLQQLNIKYLTVSRQATNQSVLYEDVDEKMIRKHTLIINTTPVGMYPGVEAAPAIPYQYITTNHLLYDLIYNPTETRFLQQGKNRGAVICNGYEMLLLQAEESWRIWNA